MAGEADLREVVGELLKIVNSTGLDRTLAIGRLVLERFFAGSPLLWQDRRRNKNNSVRRLADCPECPLSRSALNQAIGIYALTRALPSVSEFTSIGPSHLGLVTPLAPDEQQTWLERACTERWSVRRLREEIREDRRRRGERRGRPRLSHVDKALTHLRGCVQKLEVALDSLGELGHDCTEAALVLDVYGRVSALEARLAALCDQARPNSELVGTIKTDAPFPLEELRVG